MDSLKAEPARPRLAIEVFRLGAKIIRAYQPDDRLEMRQIERMRGLVRLQLDGADAHAAVAIDQHTIAAPHREVAGEIVKEMAGLLKANRDDPWKIVAAFK